jgi:predicted esterase
MQYKTFWEFEEFYSIPYAEKKYDETLAILNDSAKYLSKKDYEEHLFNIILDKARIYSKLHNGEAYLNTLREALNLGYSFPLIWKRFDFLRDNRNYPSIEELNQKLLKGSKEKARFKYEVHLPESYDPNKKYPLFLCLHGDGSDGNIPNHSWYWRSDVLTQRGFIFVYPQSSQVYCHNGFGWLIDRLKSRQELKNCYEQLLTDYSIDENCVIIGGFSGGADATIDISISNSIAVKGFVALCPSENVITFDLADAQNAAKQGIKGVVFEGEYETELPVQDMLKVFEKAGLPCKYEINKGIGHWYPKDLEAKVSRAVDCIIGD